MMTLPFAQVSFPEIYEQELVGPLFRPWAELILDDVELAAGDRVLDVACGTGIVARLAKERLGEAGRVVGVDLSPAMLAVARGLAAGIDWRQGEPAPCRFKATSSLTSSSVSKASSFFRTSPRRRAKCVARWRRVVDWR